MGLDAIDTSSGHNHTGILKADGRVSTPRHRKHSLGRRAAMPRRREAGWVTSEAPEKMTEISAGKRGSDLGAQDASPALTRRGSHQAGGCVSTPGHWMNFLRRREAMPSARSWPAHHQVGQEGSTRGAGRLTRLRAGTPKNQERLKSEILQARGWKSQYRTWDDRYQTLEPWVKG